MSTLVIDHSGAELELAGKVLTLRLPESPARRIPAGCLQRVILRADTRLSSSVLLGLADLGVAVLMQGGRRGDRVACVLGPPGNDARRRITQVRRLDDADFCAGWSRRLLRAKLSGQQRLLQRALHQRPDLRHPLLEARASLVTCRQALRESTDIARLRGLEGAAAAAYFRAFPLLFPPALAFSGRRRRPPPDPVNACLSLGYTLLYGLAVEASHAAGLDPMIGYLHEPSHGRASLACDLMEPWRPWVDAKVWALFRNRTLEAAHFGTDGSGACLLGKAGRHHFYVAWANACAPLRRALLRQAHLASKAMGDLAPPPRAAEDA